MGWKFLRNQKTYLINLEASDRLTTNEKNAISGIINYIDSIQDLESSNHGCRDIFTYADLQADSGNEDFEIEDAPWVIIDNTDEKAPIWLDAFYNKADAEQHFTCLSCAHDLRNLKILTKAEWASLNIETPKSL